MPKSEADLDQLATLLVELARGRLLSVHALVHGLVLTSVVSISACHDRGADAPMGVAAGDEDGSAPYACNLAAEVECTNTEELALNAVSSLGFSANDVLPTLVGSYEIPIAWVSPCTGGTACSPGDDCSRFAEQSPVSVAGTTTTVRAELTAERPAVVGAPGPGQDSCGQFMKVPASLTVRSADGAVDMVRDDISIWTSCGNELSVGIVGTASELGGILGAELGEGASSHLRFGATHDGRLWFNISFIRQLEDAPRPITLQSEMLQGEHLCPQYIARKDVLIRAE